MHSSVPRWKMEKFSWSVCPSIFHTRATHYSPPFYLLLHPKQGRLVPLRLWVQDFYLAPSYQYSFPNLSGQTIPCQGSDLCLIHRLHPPVVLVLVFLHEWGGNSTLECIKVFLTSGEQISRTFTNINSWTKLTLNAIVHSTPPTVTPHPPAIFTWKAGGWITTSSLQRIWFLQNSF